MSGSFSDIPDWLTIYSKTTEVAPPPGSSLDGSGVLKEFERYACTESQGTGAEGILVRSERTSGVEQLIVTPVRAGLDLVHFAVLTTCSEGKITIRERLYFEPPPQKVDLVPLPPRPPMPPGGAPWIVSAVFAAIFLFFVSCCGLVQVATLKTTAQQIVGLLLLFGFCFSVFLVGFFLLLQGFKKRQKIADSQEFKHWQVALQETNLRNQELEQRQKILEEERRNWKAQILPTVRRLATERAFGQFSSRMRAAAQEAAQTLLASGAEVAKTEEKTRRSEEIEAAIEWELAKESNVAAGAH